MLDKLYEEKGVISIFLSLVLILQIAATGLLMDYALIEIAEEKLRQAQQLASHGALSIFSSDLYERFGFFALEDQTRAQEIAKQIMRESTKNPPDDESWIRLHSIHTKITLVPDDVLANPLVSKNQLLSLMEYESPRLFIEILMDQLGYYKKLSKVVPFLKSKLHYEEKIYEVQEKIENLTQLFVQRKRENGEEWLGAPAIQVYGDRLNFLLKNPSYDQYIEAKKYYGKVLRRLEKDYKGAEKGNEKISKIQGELETIGDDEPPEVLDLSYQKALPPVRQEDLALLKEELNAIYQCGKRQYEAWANLKLGKNDFQTLSYDDFLKLDNDSRKMNLSSSILQEEKLFSKKGKAIQEDLLSSSKEERSGFIDFIQAWNERRKVHAKLRKLQREKSPILEENILNLGISPEQMKIYDQYQSNSTLPSQKLLSDPRSMLFAMDISFLEGADISILSMEQIKLLMYLTSMFSSRISPYKKEAISMLGEDLSNRKAYGAEWEYLLLANPNFGENQKQVLYMIFVLRLLANLAYAFTSPRLYSQTIEIAFALAGWTGFGIALVQSLLLLTLAMGESYLDIHDLIEGHRLPIMKTEASWRFSLSDIKMIKRDLVDKALNKLEDESLALIDAGEDMVKDLEERAKEKITSRLKVALQDFSSKILASSSLQEKEDIEEAFQKFINKTPDLSFLTFSLPRKIHGLLQERKNKPKETKRILEQMEEIIDKEMDQLSSIIDQKVQQQTKLWKSKIKDWRKGKDEIFNKKFGEKSSRGGEFSETLTMNYEDYMLLFFYIKSTSPSGFNELLSHAVRLMHIETGLDLTKASCRLKFQSQVSIRLYFPKKDVIKEIEWEEAYGKKR